MIFFFDDNVAVPVVDRLIHHSHIFMLGGDSYQLKQKMAWYQVSTDYQQQKKGKIMLSSRGGYRGKPKPKLPPRMTRVPVNVRIQQWMVDKIKEKGEVGYVLEEILINAGFEYHEPEVKKNAHFLIFFCANWVNFVGRYRVIYFGH